MSEIISKLAVELALESGSFAKQMSSINKEIKNLDRDFKNAGKGVEGFEKTFTGLDAKITKTSKQWCEYYGINQTTFKDRLNRGWTLEQALTISTKGKHKKVDKTN